MEFEEAWKLVFEGKRMRRASWPKESFIFLVPGSRFKVDRPPLLGIFPEGTEIDYWPHVDIRSSENIVSVFIPDLNQKIACDWEEWSDHGQS